MIACVPGADAGVSDGELTEPAGELTASNADGLICFVVDSPEGGTISPLLHVSFISNTDLT